VHIRKPTNKRKAFLAVACGPKTLKLQVLTPNFSGLPAPSMNILHNQ
jgi:hypothetical protein